MGSGSVTSGGLSTAPIGPYLHTSPTHSLARTSVPSAADRAAVRPPRRSNSAGSSMARDDQPVGHGKGPSGARMDTSPRREQDCGELMTVQELSAESPPSTRRSVGRIVSPPRRVASQPPSSSAVSPSRPIRRRPSDATKPSFSQFYHLARPGVQGSTLAWESQLRGSAKPQLQPQPQQRKVPQEVPSRSGHWNPGTSVRENKRTFLFSGM
eukprot:NODE_856_length_744_cov_804.696403_g655_i0.p1 GENE.NODE_856_length_744_cov_804.696403_g655_i0~~NODE_856_length_744_cov_804.696403_g655_i0.p1  ORF type:complete len:211 (-),score=22.41 NODE_856_length_744_cov_804.696403_g655_i0:79-711(-)